MSTIYLTRVCVRCKAELPFDAFYVRKPYNQDDNPPTLPGHLVSECKVCMRERADGRRKNPIPPLGPRRQSEEVVLAELARQGIPALAGKVFRTEFPHVDIVAWGCVLIEVKWARLEMHRNRELFKFNATPTQKLGGFRAQLIILLCEWGPKEYSYHVFPVAHPVFYKDGHVKVGWTFTPGAMQAKKHGNNRVVMTQPIMDLYEDRWDLIESERLRISAEARPRSLKHNLRDTD